MASPNLSTECLAFTAWPIKEDMAWTTRAIRFLDNSAITWELILDQRSRTIDLYYVCQGQSEKASFEAFWNARGGRRDPFYWNHPRTGENDIKVRFDQEAVTFLSESPRAWGWSVRLRKTR